LKTIIIKRPLLTDISPWARSAGIELKDETHVTVCFSRKLVDWNKISTAERYVTVPSIAVRSFEHFGPRMVLTFASHELTRRHTGLLSCGVSSEFSPYQPHISLCDWRSPPEELPGISLTHVTLPVIMPSRHQVSWSSPRISVASP
jgi:hypothetical protein